MSLVRVGRLRAGWVVSRARYSLFALQDTLRVDRGAYIGYHNMR